MVVQKRRHKTVTFRAVIHLFPDFLPATFPGIDKIRAPGIPPQGGSMSSSHSSLLAPVTGRQYSHLTPDVQFQNKEVEGSIEFSSSKPDTVLRSRLDYPPFCHQIHRNGFPYFDSSQFIASFDYPPPSSIRQHFCMVPMVVDNRVECIWTALIFALCSAG